MGAKPLAEIVEAGWATRAGPGGPGDRRHGRVPARRARRRPALPAGRGERAARVHPAVRRGQGADRRARTRTRRRATRSGCRSRWRRRPGRSRAHWPTSSASTRPISATRTPSTGDLTPWAEQGVLLLNRVLTVAPGDPGLAPGQGLGEGHRAGDPGAGRPRDADAPGGHPLGSRRPQPGPAAGGRAAGGVAAPEPDVGRPRILRVPPVQPGQRAAGGAGRGAGGLEAPLATRPASRNAASSASTASSDNVGTDTCPASRWWLATGPGRPDRPRTRSGARRRPPPRPRAGCPPGTR